MAKPGLYVYTWDGLGAEFAPIDPTLGAPITLSWEELAPLELDIKAHGVKAKIGDAAAKSRDTKTGASATDAIKWAAMVAVAESLRAGQWERRGGEGEGPYLLQALMEVYGQSREETTKFLSGLSTTEKRALEREPDVAPVVERLRAARAPAIDTGALIARLRGGPPDTLVPPSR